MYKVQTSNNNSEESVIRLIRTGDPSMCELMFYNVIMHCFDAYTKVLIR